MELKDLIGWVFCCFLVLCVGGSVVLGVLGWLLYQTTGHIVKAEARSREMAMSVVEDWRKYRADEHAAAQPVPEEEPRQPDNGFPDDLLPTVQVS